MAKHEDRNEDPRMPVVERSGDKEEQQPQGEDAADERGQ